MPRRYVDYYGDNQPDPAGNCLMSSMLIARLVFIIGQFAFIANLSNRLPPRQGGTYIIANHWENLPPLLPSRYWLLGSALLAAGILDELFRGKSFLSAFRPAVAVSLLFIFEAPDLRTGG